MPEVQYGKFARRLRYCIWPFRDTMYGDIRVYSRLSNAVPDSRYSIFLLFTCLWRGSYPWWRDTEASPSRGIPA